MNDLTLIVTAIKEIGFTPVVMLLILYFHFRTVRNLEKQNDKLLERNDRLLQTILNFVRRDKNGD